MRIPDVRSIPLEAYTQDEGGRVDEGQLTLNGIYVAMFDFSFAEHSSIQALRLSAKIAHVASMVNGVREVAFEILDRDLEPAMSTVCYMRDSYVVSKNNPHQGYFRGYNNSTTEQNAQSLVAVERHIELPAGVDAPQLPSW